MCHVTEYSLRGDNAVVDSQIMSFTCLSAEPRIYKKKNYLFLFNQ